MNKNESCLPPTKTETAEKRLEELVANKSITRYTMIFEGENYWYYHPVNEEIRLYPDGVEMIWKDGMKKKGMLHFERRRIVVDYDLEKEHELQRVN